MADSKVGAFLGHWLLGDPKPGAPLLNIQAIVVTPRHKIAGQAELTQAVNPPLDHAFDVVGIYHDSPSPNVRHFISLQSPATPLIGAPSIHILLELSEDWQEGTATYSYWIGSLFHDVRNVPVHAVKK